MAQCQILWDESLKKKKLPQNYFTDNDGYLTIHYVTHEKSPNKCVESVKMIPENSAPLNTMLNSIKNRELPCLT